MDHFWCFLKFLLIIIWLVCRINVPSHFTFILEMRNNFIFNQKMYLKDYAFRFKKKSLFSLLILFKVRRENEEMEVAGLICLLFEEIFSPLWSRIKYDIRVHFTKTCFPLPTLTVVIFTINFV